MDKMSVICCVIVVFVSLCGATDTRPRGVAISMASMYKPGTTFKCLDESKEVPYEYVNDDYCDCPDGSDEPGTSACPNGKFHCTNAGYKPLNILSSRVNDGICDCCDGSDEWDKSIECVNNCKELGKKMKEETERIRQLQEEGFQQKLTFIQEGKATREKKKVELEQLLQTKVELEAVKTQLEDNKNRAEAPEKEAKDKHEQTWNAELEKKKSEKERLRAEIAFTELDRNGDGKIDIAEIKSHTEFDVDSNGDVSDDEAREHLEGEDTSDLAHFTENVWPHIKDVYKGIIDEPVEETTQSTPTTPTASIPTLDDEDDGYDDDDELDEDEEDDADEDSRAENTTDERPDEDKMPDYDDATKLIIAAADLARKEFNDADQKLRDTEGEIRNLETYLGLDFGAEEEYSVLKGNCYEFTDREYTYKMCGFERATQRSKNGGAETTLGNWGRWAGPDHDKYAAQLYENGQSCWNGPNRSVKVNFKCGLEHKVTSASEPSRCEYMFDFETPARCSTPPTKASEDIHDEL